MDQTGFSNLFRKTNVRIGITSVVITGYMAIGLALGNKIGSGITITSFIPCIVAGLLWGSRRGVVIAAVLAFGLNPLIIGMSGYGYTKLWITPSGILGSVAVVIIAHIVGIIRDLRLRLTTELAARHKARDEISQAKANLELVLNNAPSGIFTVDTRQKILSWNTTAEKITGIRADDAIGKQCLEIWECSACLKGCGLFSDDTPKPVTGKICRITVPDGRTFAISKNLDLMRDNNGEMIGGIEIFEDVTEKLKIEQALRESEIRFYELFNNMSSGVALYSPIDGGKDFEIVDVNTAVENIDKVKRDEIVGMRLTHVFPGVESFGLMDILKRVSRSGRPEFMKATFYSDEKRCSWRENYVYKLPSGIVVAVYDDVTDRVTAENALKESEENFRKIFESSSEALMILDVATGRFVAVNQAMCTMFGYSQEEFEGMSPGRLVAPEDAERQNQALKNLAGGKMILNLQTTRIHRNGTRIPILLSALPTTWHGSKAIYGAMRDITELMNFQKQLVEKNREILEFTNMVTHDLRKPLTTMGMVLSMFADESICTLSEDGDEAVGMGKDALNYMKELLDDLLVCAKLEADRYELKFEMVQVADVVKQVTRRLQLQAEAAHVQIITNDLNVEVFADSKELTKIFMNLIGNAINYIGDGPERRIEIGSKMSETGVTFFVRDNGMGIPEESQGILFEKFKRGTNTAGIHGTGLGLAIVKALVEKHGGEVRFESQTGCGTTFSFSLASARKPSSEGIVD